MIAASIPLVIHLLNRRKIKRIEFSTVQFLKQMERKQMRNLRIRQILLLLIRTAIILLLVIAFARPTVKQGGALLAERSPVEAVILIDNSMSLNESRLSGSLLQVLRDRFAALEPVFQNGDRITVIQTTVPLTILAEQENYQSDLWTRVGARLQSNYLKSDLGPAFAMAAEIMNQSQLSSREVYLISDYQQSAFSGNNYDELLDALDEDEFARVFHIPLHHLTPENLSVDSINVVNQLVEVNQPLRLRSYVRNHNPDRHIASIVSVVLNGNRVAQKNVSVPPLDIKELAFDITLKESGFVSGQIELESDVILEDNQRYFNFFVPERVRILHLQGPSISQFFPLIVQPAVNKQLFEYTATPGEDWSSHNFNSYDVVVCEGLNQVAESLVNRLRNFAENGGGVIVIPGEEAVVPMYRNLLHELGVSSSFKQFGSPGDDQFLYMDEMILRHPIFEGIFDREKQINPVENYAGYLVRPSDTAEGLMFFSDDSPFLTYSTKFDGSVFFVASPLNPAWTELPHKGLVLPLFYRVIYYCALNKITDRSTLRTGEQMQLQFRNLEAPYNFSMRSAGNEETKLSPAFRSSRVYIDISETLLPDNYRVFHNDQVIGIVSVNPWVEESELTALSAADLPGAVLSEDPEDVISAVNLSRFGKELWQYFLIAALILMLLEMVVARTGSIANSNTAAGPEAVV